MQHNTYSRLTRWLVSSFLLPFVSLHAALMPDTGFTGASVYDTVGQFVLMEALDIKEGVAYVGHGTNVVSVNLGTHTASSFGSIPPNATFAYLAWRSNHLHAAYGASFTPPFSGRHGEIGSGTFVLHGSMDGIYDAVVDSDDTLYIMANPGGLGSKVFRFDPVATSLVEIIHVGGYSGPIAMDSSNRLYVGEQSFGNAKILRFTPSQLLAGNLTAADGELIVPVGATYMCLDENDRLYATLDYGNELSVYDVENKYKIRTMAIDDSSGYGIGRIAWDHREKALVTIHSDFGVFASTLNLLSFSDSDQGVVGTSAVFMGWVANYQQFNRPNTNSGGYARNNAGNPSSVGHAVVGQPTTFDPDVFPFGHILSLGEGGSIILEFDDVIKDGPGTDFVIFENGFYAAGTFSEWAFVEVATTTNAWARFPVTSFITNAIDAYEPMDVTKVDGVAGKHAMEYGTPFNLEWLKNDAQVLSGAVNLDQIAYIRIVDIIGNGSSVDQFGHPLFDPFGAAPLSTDGFDLRGVGVVNLVGVKMIPDAGALYMQWFGYQGREYHVERSGDGYIWQDVPGVVTGTGGYHRVALPNDTDADMFRVSQRVIVTP